jgi:hypothetical protein
MVCFGYITRSDIGLIKYDKLSGMWKWTAVTSLNVGKKVR